jgi:tRNA pseudouridine55 synthase
MISTPYHEGKLLLLNKPLGWTSFDVVNKVRYALEGHFKLKRMSIKVGHAGTLDPLATGLMLICTGKMTKQVEAISGLPKVYTGTFVLGATTASFDLEKPIDATFPTEHITEEMVKEVAKNFVGTHFQEPPVFSAKRVDGERAYLAARRGEEIKMRKAEIDITTFEITRIALPEVDFKVSCSKGTYIRSLARDFGLALQSGGYLSKLERTEIGKYSLADAQTVDNLIKDIRATPLVETEVK